jgi:hypothetical protein
MRRDREDDQGPPQLIPYLILTAGPVALCLVSAFGMWVADDPNDSYPGWLTAVAASGALLAASLAALYAYRAFLLESAREQDRLDAMRQAQASLVAAWYGTSTSQVLGPVYGVFLRNASDLPVTGAAVDIELVSEGEHGPRADPLGRQVLGLLPPTSDARFHPFDTGIHAAVVRAMEASRAGGFEPRIDVRLGFRDAGARHWERDADGLLRET